MKKAAPVGAASLTSRAQHGSHEPPPDTEGLAFDWSRCFHREHHRTHAGADGGTGPLLGYRDAAALLKASSIPLGARWIRVRPNGSGTEGHTTMQGRDEPGPRANLAVRSEPFKDEDPLLKVDCSPTLPMPCAPPR
jgi:hypothetical protein